MRAINRKTCCSNRGAKTRPWVCQANALLVRPLRVVCMGESTHESGLAENTLQIWTFYTLIVQTLMDAIRPQLMFVKLRQKQMEAQ